MGYGSGPKVPPKAPPKVGGAGVLGGVAKHSNWLTTVLSLGGSGVQGAEAWRNLGYPSKEAYLQAIAAHEGKSKPKPKRQFADPRGSITPGSDQPAATNLGEGAAMDAAERFRPGAGYPAGVPRPADYPVASGDTGRDTAPPVPQADIPQTGTRLSGGSTSSPLSFEEYMKQIGNRDGAVFRNPFSSNNLPDTPDHNASITLAPGAIKDTTAPVGRGVMSASIYDDLDKYIAKGNGQAVEVDTNYGAGNNVADKTDQDRTQSPARTIDPQNSGTNWMARTAADNSDVSVLRKQAFLDADDIMTGLRNSQAYTGVGYAGGQHIYYGDGTADPTFISKEDARMLTQGKASGTEEEFLSKYTGKVKDMAESVEVPKPADAQNPDITEDGTFRRVDGGVTDGTVTIPVGGSPLQSKDIPETMTDKEGEAFLANWRKQAGL